MQKNDELPVRLEHDDFLILDEADEKQIAEVDQKIKDALVYELKGNKELSYVGLKHLTLMMSQKGQALQVLEDECELKDGIWYAKMKVKNLKTQHETVGYAQQPARMQVGEEEKPDAFARTKAFSKAERNAWRKQIPELQIKSFIEVITKKNGGKTTTLSKTPPSESKYCMCDFKDMVIDPKTNGCSNRNKPMTDNQRNAVQNRS